MSKESDQIRADMNRIMMYLRSEMKMASSSDADREMAMRQARREQGMSEARRRRRVEQGGNKQLAGRARQRAM